MSQMENKGVGSLWERLVRCALGRGRTGFTAYRHPAGSFPGTVPRSLSSRSNIDLIIRAADEIHDEDPNVSRIFYEHAYLLATNLGEGRGVLRFKLVLLDTLDKQPTKMGAGICSDIACLLRFYKLYREKNGVDKLREEEMESRMSPTFSGNFQELERQAVTRKRVFATLKVYGAVLMQLLEGISPDHSEELNPDELKRMVESDVAMIEDSLYNIISLDTPVTTNAITLFPEVRAAISSLKYFTGLPELPENFLVPATRTADVLDFLHYIFGFQIGNVSNQRENVVNLLSNEESRLGIRVDHEPKLDKTSVDNVFSKSLDNYIHWCKHLGIPPMWSKMDISQEKKVLFISLYFLIWGEAANVRHLPECLCYIFHRMGEELDDILGQLLAKPAKSCVTAYGVSFLEKVICPLYDVIAAEADHNKNGKALHSAWPNYDDFNEYFRSCSCFELGWPLNTSFLLEPSRRSTNISKASATKHRGETSFVGHRTFFHLYCSFHRLWKFLFMTFQALATIAFNDGKLDEKTVLSLGPTLVLMNLFQSLLDSVMYRAFSIRDFVRSWGLVYLMFLVYVTVTICNRDLYVISLDDRLLVGILMVYICLLGWKFAFAYSRRGMGYIKNWDTPLWLIILGWKFAFAYFLLIRPLVKPTRLLIDSKDNHNALTIASLWALVFCIYLLDIHIFYTIISAAVGFFLGARDRLGKITSLGAIHKLFERFPKAFMDNLHIPIYKSFSSTTGLDLTKNMLYAAQFSPFWNEIVNNLREEDYIANLEMELLQMPKSSGSVPVVQWPLFLLVGKISLAKDIAEESNSQEELWDRISRDNYMKSAVEECFYTSKLILTSVFLEHHGMLWVEKIYLDIMTSISKRCICADFKLKSLALLIQKVAALTGILKEDGTPELETGAINAARDLHHFVDFVFCRLNKGSRKTGIHASLVGGLFSTLKWPRDPELRSQIRRLHLLITIKDSAVNVPRNLEARRRLEFFTNSLFMSMPRAKPVREMLSFSVFIPYHSETVLYSMKQLLKKNEEGISILFHLQKIYPDEWKNFLARINRDENTHESVLFDNPDDNLELRLWASYRGQTLARTVRGMMYYRKALMFQAYLERTVGDMEAPVADNKATDTSGFEFSPEARAHADHKYTCVVACQMYGDQNIEHGREAAADIGLLLQRNEALRVAFIAEEWNAGKKEFFSKLVKGDHINGKDKEVYSIKLPGNPFLGEGKSENQNHGIIFTRGHALQTIDMNQDIYFEEALKMRNLLEEFNADYDGIRGATILGVREHLFAGSVSSLAFFTPYQETSFVNLEQRVLALLNVRMHYGRSAVFDRVFHITRGGISKAFPTIDNGAGFNSTLRQGNITRHEYIQLGKRREVGLHQIALSEGKLAGRTGEQVLSWDVYRLGQSLDFFRMLSFYTTTVGYYFSNMLTVIALYIILYGKLYLALSGVGEDVHNRAGVLDLRALDAALTTHFLYQIGVFTTIPMVLGLYLEQGFLTAVVDFITMLFQIFFGVFTFSLGTRVRYFGRTFLHGGAKYHATGQEFFVHHIRFSENYRLYSRSHFFKAFEVLSLVVYSSYLFNEACVKGDILSVGSCFVAISWLVAPFWFNPSGFEWHNTVEDFQDWTSWLTKIGVKSEESWEAWWIQECSHIRTLGGRITETILSLHFFIFQYGVVYKLDVHGSNTSFLVYVSSSIFLVSLILLHLSVLEKSTIDPSRFAKLRQIFRYVQLVACMLLIFGIAIPFHLGYLTITHILASILAFIHTGWGILSICVAWKPVLEKIGLWKSVVALARLYDAGMGMLILVPIACCSCFPFISTFHAWLMFMISRLAKR